MCVIPSYLLYVYMCRHPALPSRSSRASCLLCVCAEEVPTTSYIHGYTRMGGRQGPVCASLGVPTHRQRAMAKCGLPTPPRPDL